MIRVKLSDGLGNTQIRIFGYPDSSENGFTTLHSITATGKLNKDFLHFLPYIWFIIDDFSKFQCLRKIIKYSKDLAKK